MTARRLVFAMTPEWTPLESLEPTAPARLSATSIVAELPDADRSTWVALGRGGSIRALLTIRLLDDRDGAFADRYRAALDQGGAAASRSVDERVLPAGLAIATYELEIPHEAEGMPDPVLERLTLALRFGTAATVALFILATRDLAAAEAFAAELWSMAGSARLEEAT